MPDPVYPTVIQDSPLRLTAFNDLEDELFGLPGTPDRLAYEEQAKLAPLPGVAATPT